ncbi:MAG: aminotransferase class III-fold pyridoxal phosphate-dependent enzyme [Leptospira sp.]|nr:aminotransferase class III-fold pyridoxal phosphate-dependent enzyme [Leptospira sp.]
MKIIAVIQARMGSTRLPNKVMKQVNGVPLIELLIKRLSGAKLVNQIMLATSTDDKNIPLVNHVRSLGYDVFQGSENDVLSRYYHAVKDIKPDAIVRITGDCPLVDPKIVDQIIETFLEKKVDYASNTIKPTYPDGIDVSMASFQALERAFKEATSEFDREHIMPYIRNPEKFKLANVEYKEDYSKERWTVDEPEDFEVIQNVFNHFHPRIDFSWLEVLQLLKDRPELFAANRKFMRNEGSVMGNGQKLWRRAKQVIPGGNMLLSKRAEMFLPEQWPAYFTKAKGSKVWDLDGKEYTDMLFAVGTSTLGYGNEEVDSAVAKAVTDGTMSSLNCPEEVYLAEKLIELHPWAEMVRFARSGGEANAIAIRIARAASGREKVAFCGYHGWHDWYLAANLSDGTGLNGHLLPGLEPNGVPNQLKGTVLPFNYNKIEELEALIKNHDIGVIKMEVSRNLGPEDNFLHKVRDLATKHNIVLIFDECTSGFRQTFGGLHKFYGVEPDLAMFGKALGNGYAVTATIGRRKFMEAAQSTFISSTFWTERIGAVAGLKTLEVMERVRSWETITETGKEIAKIWENLGKKHSIPVRPFGLPALIKLAFDTPNALAYKTIMTQEMLKRGFLASNIVYVSTAHTKEVLSAYTSALDEVFGIIKECEDGRDIQTILNGPICHAEFKRLN